MDQCTPKEGVVLQYVYIYIHVYARGQITKWYTSFITALEVFITIKNVIKKYAMKYLIDVRSDNCSIVHCLMYSVHCTVYNVQCTMYSVQCTMYSVQCTMYSVQQYLTIREKANHKTNVPNLDVIIKK